MVMSDWGFHYEMKYSDCNYREISACFIIKFVQLEVNSAN